MTAVEFLLRELRIEDLAKGEQLSVVLDICEEAKEMEKQQIIDAWIATDNELQIIAAEQYYNETYGKGNDDKKINLVEIPQEQLEKERNPNYKYFDTRNLEISDEEIKRKIEREIKKRYETTQNDAGFRDGWFLGIEWYKQKLNNK